MKVTCRLPDHAVAVEALLEGFVQACQVCLEAGLAPPDPLQANVRYQLEPAGEEDWKLPQNVVRDGWGDCEDLAGWRAARLRMTGEDPGARAIVAKTGPHKLHCVVQRSDGSIDDPSHELAMRERASVGAGPFRIAVDRRRGGSGPNRRRGDDQPGLSPGVSNPDDGGGDDGGYRGGDRRTRPGDTQAQAFVRRHADRTQAPRVLQHTRRQEGERHDVDGNIVNEETAAAAAADQQAQLDQQQQQLQQQQMLMQQQMMPGYGGAPYGMPYIPQDTSAPGSYFEGLTDTIWDPEFDEGGEA